MKRQHMEHIAEKGARSFHYGLVHKPVPVQEALKIPKTEAAGDKEWEHWNPRRDVGSLTPGSMEQCREQSFVSCEYQIDC